MSAHHVEVREHLDDPSFHAAWAEGRRMTLEQAIAYALEEVGDELSNDVIETRTESTRR